MSATILGWLFGGARERPSRISLPHTTAGAECEQISEHVPVDQTSSALVEAIRTGDAEAFRTLVEQHFPAMVRLARVITGSSDMARDVVQDVFMDLWMKGAALDIRGDVRGYLWSATRNRARMVVRHARVERRYRDMVHTQDTGISSVTHNPALGLLEMEDVVAQVDAVLAKVPARCREIFLLRWRDEFTPDEIAQALGIGVSTVRNQISRAVRRLAEHFGIR